MTTDHVHEMAAILEAILDFTAYRFRYSDFGRFLVCYSPPQIVPETRRRPNFGFGFGFGAECGQMGTFGGHSVSAESSRTTFGPLSVSSC